MDTNENVIECIHEKGIETTYKDFEFDVTIYASSFVAVNGYFSAADIHGIWNRKLADE